MQSLGIEVKEKNNKPLNKIDAYWTLINDMKVIKWGDAVEQLELGRRG